MSVFAHHVTKAFMPKDGSAGVEVGRKRVLRGVGYVLTPEVHVVLVEDPQGELTDYAQAHINIASAAGVAPIKSIEAVAEAQQNGAVVPIEHLWKSQPPKVTSTAKTS